MLYFAFIHLRESTAWAVLIAGIVYAMRKRPAAVRFSLWFLAILKFAIPSVLIWRLGLRFAQTVGANYPVLPIRTSFVASVEPYTGAWLNSLALLVFAVWLCGTITLLTKWLPAFLINPRLATARASEQSELDALRQRLKMRTPVELQYLCSGWEAGVWGVWRPKIRIAEALPSRLNPDEFQAILLHELAHIRRRDNLIGLITHLVVCLFWFHPLLWWIERRMLAEREGACDEIVLEQGSQPDTYAASLLKVCQFQFQAAIAGRSGITNSNLQRRMEFLMSYRVTQKFSQFFRILPGTLAMLVALVPFTSGFILGSSLLAHVSSSQSCLADGKRFAAGSVIAMGSAAHECLGGKWIQTTKRVNAAYHQRQPTFCEVQASSSITGCRCQDGEYSLGAITRSSNGEIIRCDKFQLGGFTTWRAVKPSELGR